MDIIDELNKKIEKNYIIIEKDLNKKGNYIFLHKKCNTKFSTSKYHFFKENTRCPICSIKKRSEKRRFTNETFLEKIKEIVGEEYTFLENYKGTSEKIKVRHNCNFCNNNEYYVSPNKFFCGRRCPICSNNKKGTHLRKYFSIEDAKNKIFEICKDEYEILSESYSHSLKKLKFRHNSKKCGNYVFNMTLSSFISGDRCPICAKKVYTKESLEYFLKSNNYLRENFSIIDFDNERKKLKISHQCTNEKKREFELAASYIHSKTFRGLICPFCEVKSFGNLYISEFLNEKKIKYIKEFSDPRFIYKKMPLRFDFKIFLNDKDFFYLEFDGIQHSKLCSYFDSKDSFENRKNRDNLKNEKCKEYNIKLFRLKDINTVKKDLQKILESLLNRPL